MVSTAQRMYVLWLAWIIRRIRSILVFVGFIALSACVHNGQNTGPEGAYTLAVPEFQQRGRFDCVPAALSAVYRFWGRDDTEDEVADRLLTIRSGRSGGTINLMPVVDARRCGMNAIFRLDAPEELRHALRQGVPVMALTGPSRRSHMVIISGFGKEGDIVYFRVYDGSKPSRWVGDEEFLKSWKKSGNFMLTVWPKGYVYSPMTELGP